MVTGPVLETMNASNYTYVRVKTDGGRRVGASGEFKVAVGDRVTLALEMPMENFHSETLKRDFPLIYFTTRIGPEGQAPPRDAGHDVGARDGGRGASRRRRGLAGDRADSARSGRDDCRQGVGRPESPGRQDRDRARKVVKFNGGILGRNWIHIQDGTGAAADGTNDLLVTSDAAANVGDVITVTGTVAVDKDFTAGYAYAVLVEGAKIELK